MRNQTSNRYSDNYDSYDRNIEADDDMAATHQRLAELKKQKEEVESVRRKITETQHRKNTFLEAQNNLGEKMYQATEQIAHDIISMRKELELLESLQTHISKSLKVLSTIQPEEWTPDSTDHQLLRGQEVMSRCESEFSEAVQETVRMKHIKPLTNLRHSHIFKISFKDFSYQFMQGLSFHLSLLIVLGFALAFYCIFFK